jgi:hypothetical protein
VNWWPMSNPYGERFRLFDRLNGRMSKLTVDIGGTSAPTISLRVTQSTKLRRHSRFGNPVNVDP